MTETLKRSFETPLERVPRRTTPERKIIDRCAYFGFNDRSVKTEKGAVAIEFSGRETLCDNPSDLNF